MDFYQTPNGVWSTTEKQWKEDMKAEDTKPTDELKAICKISIPTAKVPLLEFLTFHNINIRFPRGTSSPVVAPVDLKPEDLKDPQPGPVIAAPTTIPDPDALVASLPLTAQMDLAVGIIDRVNAELRGEGTVS